MRLLPSIAVAAALAGLGTCGCTATPLPEPPAEVALDFGQIAWPAVYPEGNIIDFDAGPGTGPAGYTLRVTNLDDQNPPVETVIADDGSFFVSLPGVAMDELRFHLRDGRERAAPQDFVWGAGETDPQRHACVTVTPLQQQDFGFVPVGGTPAVHSLSVRNDCTSDVQVIDARMRRSGSSYALGAAAPALPLNIPPGTSATWPLEFAPTMAGDDEEIFFLEITLAADQERYPITLYGDGT